MSQVKHAVIEMIQSLPEDVSTTDILYHLYVRQKVEQGMEDWKQGKVISQQEVEKKVEEWVKSFGQAPL